MEFFSLLATDNPYKFFFLAGIILLSLGIYYPINIRQSLDIKKNKVQEDTAKLTFEINELRDDLLSSNEEAKELTTKLEYLVDFKKKNKSKSDSISKLINNMKIEWSKNSDFIITAKSLMDVKLIDQKYQDKEISIYKKHLNEIGIYSFISITLGSIFTLIGGIMWIRGYHKRNNDVEIHQIKPSSD